MFPFKSLSVLCFLFLVHFAECKLNEQSKAGIPHSSTIHQYHVLTFSSNHSFAHPYSVDSKKVFDIMVHGILLWASMGFLMPLGILTMRMSTTTDCHRTRHRILFYLHATLQALAVLLATIAAVLSIRNFENSFNNIHQRIGLALYVAISVQSLISFRRPKRGAKGRTAWYFLHWTLGTTISLVGTLNIYTGLNAYHKRTSRSTAVWTIIFTAQVSFMAILYMVQDKWEYLQKQGIITATSVPEETTSSMVPQKDSLNEPSRKSNALGTYLSRTNALDKLFQLT